MLDVPGPIGCFGWPPSQRRDQEATVALVSVPVRKMQGHHGFQHLDDA